MSLDEADPEAGVEAPHMKWLTKSQKRLRAVRGCYIFDLGSKPFRFAVFPPSRRNPEMDD